MVSIVSVNPHGKEGFLNGKGPEIFKMTHFFHSSPRRKTLQFKKNVSFDTKYSENAISKSID